MAKKTLQEAYQTIKKIKYIIENEIGDDFLDGHDLEYDKNSENDDFLYHQVRHLLSNQLTDIKDEVSYLEKPIKHEGRLALDSGSGRFVISDPGGENLELTAGTIIEVWLHDEWREKEGWNATRIEHTGVGKEAHYYLYDFPELSLNGLRARKR